MTKNEMMTRFLTDATAYLAKAMPSFLHAQANGMITDYDDYIPATLEAMHAITLALSNNDNENDAFLQLLSDDMNLEAIMTCDFDSPLIEEIIAPSS